MSYYLDAPSLGSATAVYNDAALTICAPDGFYSDTSIVRELVGCVLQPQQFCPSCGIACGEDCNNLDLKTGVYKVTVDLGNDPTSIGAVIIIFNPQDFPKGFEAEYDGVVYNALSSPTYGFLQGDLGLPTYIGDEDLDCGLITGFHVLPNYIFNPSTLMYDLDGTTQIVNIFPTQVETTVNNPGPCVLVIPKPSINPSSLTITVFSPCSSVFDLSIKCPTVLPIFYGGQPTLTPEETCFFEDTITYYSAPVNGNGTILGLFDWVFLDINGEFHASDGYYHAPTALPSSYDWFRLENGVIVEFGQCSYNNFIIERCADGLQLVADSSIPFTIGDLVTVSDVTYAGCTFTVIDETNDTPVVTVNAISPAESCSDICAFYLVNNISSLSQQGAYINCDGVFTTFTIAANTIEYLCARSESITIDGSPGGVLVEFFDCNCTS